MLVVGVIMALGTLSIFKLYEPKGAPYAQTMAFTTLVMFQMFNVLNCKSEDKSLFKVGIFSNMWLIGAIILSALLQVAVIHTPLSFFLKTTPLTLTDWVYVILVASTVLIAVELLKLFYRSKSKK